MTCIRYSLTAKTNNYGAQNDKGFARFFKISMIFLKNKCFFVVTRLFLWYTVISEIMHSEFKNG